MTKEDEQHIIKRYREIFGNSMKSDRVRTRHSIYSAVAHVATKYEINNSAILLLGQLYKEDSPQFFMLAELILDVIIQKKLGEKKDV